MAINEKGGQMFFDSSLLLYISKGDNEKARSFVSGIENLRNLTNSSGKTLLHIAARYGNAIMTRYFIDMGFEVDARNNFGITPLALAVQYRQVETIAILLQANADVYNSEHRQCLLQTVYNCYVSKQQPVKKYEEIYAMFAKRVCEDFRKDKSTMSKTLFDAKCSLHLVVTILRSPKLTKYYIANGYDVNAAEPYRQSTALHAAVRGTDLPTIKVLLENNADVNALDRHQHTPLRYYNYTSRESSAKLDMLRYLMDHGASFDLVNKLSNSTPLQYLLIHANVKTIGLLLESNVDLKEKTHISGKTALHFLAYNTFPGIMSLLEGQEFEVDARDGDGNTPLMYAVMKNKNFSSVEFLLNHGADVNAQNNKGETPLYYAVTNTFLRRKLTKISTDICNLLLQRKANIQSVFKTFNKKTVIEKRVTLFDLIVRNEQFDVSKLLLGQLALNNVAYDEQITDLVQRKIASHKILKDQFSVCKEQIEKMKVAKINDSLTLFKLLTDNEDNMLHCAIDFEFISKLDQLIDDIFQENNYYVDVMNKRLVNIVDKLKSTKEYEAPRPRCCIT